MKNKIYEKNAVKWSNVYYECDDYIILNISKSETNESYDVLIDKEDFDLVKQGQWFIYNPRKNSNLKDIYNIIWTKRINGKKINYEIYQYILGTKHENIIVDHKNMNRFDNRKKNLRIVTSRDNAINQEHKGYYYEKSTGKYLARVRIGKRSVNIGRYKTELEAETIYLKASMIIQTDSISYDIKERIGDLNIKLTKEDYDNKYIKKLLEALENKHDFSDTKNGRTNFAYDENIDIICELVSQGYSYNKIANTLKERKIKGLEHAKSDIIKKRYLAYKEKLSA
jgi:hypothetical protein